MGYKILVDGHVLMISTLPSPWKGVDDLISLRSDWCGLPEPTYLDCRAVDLVYLAVRLCESMENWSTLFSMVVQMETVDHEIQ